ncbi:DUF3320 domain-containing protein, partial [Eubacteriales bacterium OttesenSCG-928-K08]|nr:DUF3320 domain-containing protein [Eubacteriales bacterium OttesenSCG-928-K08]
MEHRVCVDGQFLPAINFSLQQNAVPIVRSLTLKNQTDNPIENITISVSTLPGFALPLTLNIGIIPAGESISLGSQNLIISPDYLFSLTEKVLGSISVTVTNADGLLGEKTQPVELLCYDQWSGSLIMPEMLAAFVTPNHPDVVKMLADAGALLEKWSKDPSFSAYQSNDKNRVRMQIAAIYGAIKQQSIGYITAPPSFEPSGQRIRLISSILSGKMANCLELTLLFAACLEAVGLNALLVLIEGHAFVGCWLEDLSFAECLQDDASQLSKRIAKGIHEICLVECTAMCAGRELDFEAAEYAAAKHLETTRFDMALDLKRTRNSGIRPIPLRITGEDGKITYENETKHAELPAGLSHAPGSVQVFAQLQYVDSIPLAKRQIWERKLLDLSLRNTLINFRVTKGAIQLLANDLGRLEDEISGGHEFQIFHIPKDFSATMRDSKIFEAETGSDILNAIISAEFQNRRLRTFLNESELDARVTHLYRQAKLGLEENGANTLFLALGFLRWYETEASEKARFAPLVLLPVDIVRKSALKGYVIRVRDEEPRMNVTLLEMLRQDFGIGISGLDPLPVDEAGLNLELIFNIIRQAVMGKSRWDVEALAFLGIFSFGQFIMWNDIRNRAEELSKNKIVASLISGKMEWEEQSSFFDADVLDKMYPPASLAVPTSADSSQLRAIAAASAGRSFVLHGPPGTGKSQTITNIIANMLFQGKTVLFIAEKMAALSVVEKRLSDMGLGAFSLELHSNKARKRDVLNQLEQTLSIGRIKSPEEYGQIADRLYAQRQSLQQAMEAVHNKRACGLSLYETICIYEERISAPDGIGIPPELLSVFEQNKYARWTDELQKTAAAAGVLEGIHEHPLKSLRCSDYSNELRTNVVTLGGLYKAALKKLDTLAGQMRKIFDFPALQFKWQYSALCDVCSALGEGDVVPEPLYRYELISQLENAVELVCGAGNKRNKAEQELTANFREPILNFDEESARFLWEQAAAKWFLPRALGQGKIIRQLKPLCKNPAALNKQSIPALLDTIALYKQNAQVVDRHNEQFEKLFGYIWQSGNGDFEQLRSVYRKAVSLNAMVLAISGTIEQKAKTNKALAAGYFTDPSAFRQLNHNALLDYNAAWLEVLELEQKLAAQTAFDFAMFEQKQSWLNSMAAEADGWLEHIGELRDWCVYLTCKNQADALGLSCATEALERGAVLGTELLSAFEKALHKSAAEAIIAAEPALKSFSGTILEQDILNYRRLTQRFEELTQKELVSRLSQRVPVSGNVADSSETGLLKRAIKSGGRGLSIRKLFDSIPNLLERLCPCMLMSPISVAQYIDPKYPQFDLVIFDEASQLPTSEAVGAIARGKNLIVVGDPKQLPPTSFFMANRVDEDDFEQEDLESILDDCLALSLPEAYLLWHYRSRHESLIAFSNRRFYNNALFTFPSPNDKKSSVSFVHVSGFYDRSRTRQNEAEANAVVEEIARRLRDDNLRKKSIGVVTFSAVQQNLIDDKLQAIFAREPELDAFNSSAAEPIFIKNLENVQGDERDIILFSIGYGPDEQNKVTLNFGPLNREGGWRRLNVAVSRARQEMIVYSTLLPEQIDLSRTRASGVADLRAFLEFAKNGKDALPTKAADITREAGALEQNVAAAIRGAGYAVDTNAGYSQYRVDVAVLHPDRPDEYLLGLLFDGASYKNANTVRDRNLLQESVLQSLGWHIHRVWVTDWQQNPQRELKKIIAAIEQARKNRPHLPIAKEKPNAAIQTLCERVETAQQEHNELIKYATCSLEPVNKPQEEFFRAEGSKIILGQIKTVLDMEAPISSALLTKRILAAWGISRAGTRIVSQIKAL